MQRNRPLSAQAISVLRALAADPSRWRDGYDLATEVHLKSGSLYPILVRLADRGLLEAAWEPGPEGLLTPAHVPVERGLREVCGGTAPAPPGPAGPRRASTCVQVRRHAADLHFCGGYRGGPDPAPPPDRSGGPDGRGRASPAAGLGGWPAGRPAGTVGPGDDRRAGPTGRPSPTVAFRSSAASPPRWSCRPGDARPPPSAR